MKITVAGIRYLGLSMVTLRKRLKMTYCFKA